MLSQISQYGNTSYGLSKYPYLVSAATMELNNQSRVTGAVSEHNLTWWKLHTGESDARRTHAHSPPASDAHTKTETPPPRDHPHHHRRHAPDKCGDLSSPHPPLRSAADTTFIVSSRFVCE